MIKRLRIENFRSCQRIVLNDLTEIVALIGKNGAGKTNIIRAINWVARMATNPTYVSQQFHAVAPDTKPIIEMDAEVGGTLYSYSLERNSFFTTTAKESISIELRLKEKLSIKVDAKEHILFQRDGEEVKSDLRPGIIKLSAWVGSLIGILSVLPPSDALVKAIQPFWKFLALTRYYPIDEPVLPKTQAFWVEEKAYREWVTRYSETGEIQDDVSMRIIHMFLNDKDKLIELNWTAPLLW
jgi:energy-coupling factor transporter ATP-binding protein EcfA2